MAFSVEHPPTKKQFLINMQEKITDQEFIHDIQSILKPQVEYDNLIAWELVRSKLIEQL